METIASIIILLTPYTSNIYNIQYSENTCNIFFEKLKEDDQGYENLNIICIDKF